VEGCDSMGLPARGADDCRTWCQEPKTDSSSSSYYYCYYHYHNHHHHHHYYYDYYYYYNYYYPVRAAIAAATDSCGCEEANVTFCNYDFVTTGRCEYCPLGGISACDRMGLPERGVADCKKRCAGVIADYTQNTNDMAGSCGCEQENEQFCNYDHGTSGFCERCPSNGVEGCDSMGLPARGADDCRMWCQEPKTDSSSSSYYYYPVTFFLPTTTSQTTTTLSTTTTMMTTTTPTATSVSINSIGVATNLQSESSNSIVSKPTTTTTTNVVFACVAVLLISLFLVGSVLVIRRRRRPEVECGTGDSALEGELVKVEDLHGTPDDQCVDVVVVGSETATGPFVKGHIVL